MYSSLGDKGLLNFFLYLGLAMRMAMIHHFFLTFWLLLQLQPIPVSGFAPPIAIGIKVTTFRQLTGPHQKFDLEPTSLANSYFYRRKHGIESQTALQLDIFGLGPTEVLFMAAAIGVLYGPDRFKSQLRGKGVQGQIVSKGWRADRLERIDNLKKRAATVRTKRALNRLNKAMEDEVPYVLEKIAEFEDLDG